MALKSKQERVLTLAEKLGVLRPRDLDAEGIPRVHLQRLVKKGLLQRVGRGLYSRPDIEATENHDLVEAGRRVPHGVVCLLSALRFHGLTTQLPRETWLAVHYKARLPRVDYPPLKIVRFSGKALSEGIQEERIEGAVVKIYSPAKTVADCFKYRNKIGLDVAIEALRDCWTKKKATMDELWRFAKVCRVSNVMRPYLEAIAS